MKKNSFNILVFIFGILFLITGFVGPKHLISNTYSGKIDNYVNQLCSYTKINRTNFKAPYIEISERKESTRKISELMDSGYLYDNHFVDGYRYISSSDISGNVDSLDLNFKFVSQKTFSNRGVIDFYDKKTNSTEQYWTIDLNHYALYFESKRNYWGSTSFGYISESLAVKIFEHCFPNEINENKKYDFSRIIGKKITYNAPNSSVPLSVGIDNVVREDFGYYNRTKDICGDFVLSYALYQKNIYDNIDACVQIDLKFNTRSNTDIIEYVKDFSKNDFNIKLFPYNYDLQNNFYDSELTSKILNVDPEFDNLLTWSSISIFCICSLCYVFCLVCLKRRNKGLLKVFVIVSGCLLLAYGVSLTFVYNYHFSSIFYICFLLIYTFYGLFEVFKNGNLRKIKKF